jgi:hypothetical protein
MRRMMKDCKMHGVILDLLEEFIKIQSAMNCSL